MPDSDEISRHQNEGTAQRDDRELTQRVVADATRGLGTAKAEKDVQRMTHRLVQEAWKPTKDALRVSLQQSSYVVPC